MRPGKGYASKVTWHPEGEKMSLVHNYGMWIGLKSRERACNGDADARSRGRAPWPREPLKMRGAHQQDTPGAIEKGSEIHTPLLRKGLQTSRDVPREWESQPGSDLSFRFPCRIHPQPS